MYSYIKYNGERRVRRNIGATKENAFKSDYFIQVCVYKYNTHIFFITSFKKAAKI